MPNVCRYYEIIVNQWQNKINNDVNMWSSLANEKQIRSFRAGFCVQQRTDAVRLVWTCPTLSVYFFAFVTAFFCSIGF